jgi:hypothetical protein
MDALNDLGVMTRIIEKVALDDIEDAHIRALFEEFVKRTEGRERWTGGPPCRHS